MSLAALLGKLVNASGKIDPAKLAQPLTLNTSVATTSGSAIDISTTVPSWVRRITVMLSGTSNVSSLGAPLIQIGSGAYDTTGYTSSSTYSVGTNNVGSLAATNGLLAAVVLSGTTIFSGVLVLTHMGGNLWLASGTGTAAGLTGCYVASGTKALSGVLDRIRITWSTADTFDAGSANIMFEG